MSSCANIVNRLQSDVCLIKENWSYIDYSALILKMNQGIFFNSPLIVYIIPNTNPNVLGIPLNVEVSSSSSLTTSTYSALLITDRFGNEPADILEYDSIVYTTQSLLNFGQRTSTGFFEMTDTLPIVLIDADPNILPTLTYSEVVAALQSCVNSSDNHTVTWGPYNALNIYLKKNFGVKNLSPSLAACFYDYFNQNANKVVEPTVEKEEPVVYLSVDDSTKDKTEVSIILSSIDDTSSKVITDDDNTLTTVVEEPVKERTLQVDLYEVCVERAYPFEPFEPFEPTRELLQSDRDIKVEKVKPVQTVPEPIVRHIEDSATTTTDSTTESSSNDAIEAKLRALLEATETSEVTRSE